MGRTKLLLGVLMGLLFINSVSFAGIQELLAQDGSQFKVPNFIAHAGGTYMNYTYSNSKEALDNAYDNGYRVIEMDFYKTNEKDLEGRFVLLHSDEIAKRYFGAAANDGLSYDEFLTKNRVSYLTLLTIDDLELWLSEHQDVFIVSDKLTLSEYKRLAALYPYLKQALLPQVNSMTMYKDLKKAGFKYLIWTVYATTYSAHPEKIIALSPKINVVGITMPYETAKRLSTAQIKSIQKYNKIFVHTINAPKDIAFLRKKGINGFYTDQLELSKE